MWDNYSFDLNVWYMTKDYKDLKRIEISRGSAEYDVVIYYSCERCFSGSLAEVQKYMKDNCISHDKFIRWCMSK